jgi:SNF2 family DNA or RNA helicase
VVRGPAACIFSLCSVADVSNSHVTCSKKTYTLFLKKMVIGIMYLQCEYMNTCIAYLSLPKCKFLLVCSFQNLLAVISLRRTKDMETGSKSMVNLPSKTVLACYVDLSAEERKYYDQMELEGKNKMQEFDDRDSILRNYSTVLYFILRLRQLCDDVALCPLDMKSWLPADSLEGMPSVNILISGTVI